MNRQERALLKMDEILLLVRERMKDETGYDEHLLYSLATQLALADERIEALESHIVAQHLYDRLLDLEGRVIELEDQIESIERRMP